ncbi:MAG: two-component system response regulator MtrA [Roseiflexaceae bacterium]
MKILLVDDDLTLAEVTGFALRRAGFLVVLADTGDRALVLWEQELPDLIILDIQLPGQDGLSVCQQIRARSAVPIIMLTVRNSDEDVVRGLELGADDYVAKPFSPKQLIARVRAVLRRSSLPIPQQVAIGELVLDTNRQILQIPGGAIKLTRLEFRLLHYLMTNHDQVITTEALLTHVWGYSDSTDRMLLKQLVYRVRQKLIALHYPHELIGTVPGLGYILNAPLPD